MTRDDIKKLFPDATDDQITNLLNMNNTEVAKERSKGEKYKADADKYKTAEQEKAALQAQIDEAEQGKLTEVERLNKEAEKASARIAELEKNIAIRDQKATIAEKLKLTAEQANQIVKDDGSLDYDVLGRITSEKESAAALAKEREIAAAAANPNGGKGGAGGDDGKSSAVRLVEKHFSSQKTANTDIISQYANGGK